MAGAKFHRIAENKTIWQGTSRIHAEYTDEDLEEAEMWRSPLQAKT
jgi:hypothetical protein